MREWEYKALIEQKTWTFVREISVMTPIPFTWNLWIKHTVKRDAELLYQAKSCLKGNEKVPGREFNPAPVHNSSFEA